MDREVALDRLAASRSGHLATADASGIPHVVPFVFALEGSTLYWAVDQKPKRSTKLRRLQNIEANPNVAVMVDGYEEDWNALWWVRADGHARVVEDDEERARALRLLTEKYPQHRANPPEGPVVAIDLVRISGWAARDD